MSESTHPIPQNIGAPATRALTGAGYTTLEQLAKLSEKELLSLHGVGPRAIKILREAFAEANITSLL